MTRSEKIAALDMSDVDGVKFTHRADIPVADPNYTVFELSYRGATRYLIIPIRGLFRDWLNDKADYASEFKRKVDSELTRPTDTLDG